MVARYVRMGMVALAIVSAAPARAAEPFSPPDVVVYALGLLGANYRFGGDTPESGLDCSGLVRYVFQQATGVNLPRTSKEMSAMGKRIAASDLQPGDLVFFDTRRFAFSHVGIYVGDNRFIHAPSRGAEVEIAQLTHAYWQKRYNGARRLDATP
jgi:cell wall-associated NlpC family hydrolase